MNAFNTINLAGVCILTSTENARNLGIPSDRWIYPLGGAGTRDSDECQFVCFIISDYTGLICFVEVWERPEYWWSPSISKSIDAGLEASGLTKDEIDLYDFYS
jgi:hypothetical protein